VGKIKKAMGKNFKLVTSEGLGFFPPPSKPEFVNKFSGIYKMLQDADKSVKALFQFNSWVIMLIMLVGDDSEPSEY
jgi:hypothetical protein